MPMVDVPSNYDPNKNQNAGYVSLKQGTVADSDKKTLLYLLFWLTYTEDGRVLLKKNRPSATLTPEQASTNLSKVFNDEFGISEPALVTALVSGHLAADRFVAAANGSLDKQTSEKIYEHNMSFVMWKLWEDSLNHEFSMNW